jgi:hypothetical protein
MVTFDECNTYVIFNRLISNDIAQKRLMKKLLGILNAIGIGSADIEVIDKPPVIRIAKTEVTYGTPPQAEELADYIDKSLKIDVKTENRVLTFIDRLSSVLRSAGDKTAKLLPEFPTANRLALLDRKAFLAVYSDFMAKLEKPEICAFETISKVDAIFDEYFKATYPTQKAK